jgi:hypothetical protein
MTRFIRLLMWVLAGGFIAQASFGQAPSDHPALRSVRDWYKAFEGSAGIRAQYGGYVGGRFDTAYALLSAAMNATMPKPAFEEIYAEVAHMKLLQAHLVRVDERAGAAEVFVEEERTIVARTGANEQVPAIAWYTGTLKLERNNAGVWQIDSMAIMPEDIISLQYGGHSPWVSEVQEVAQVAAGAYRKRECGVDTPSGLSHAWTTGANTRCMKSGCTVANGTSSSFPLPAEPISTARAGTSSLFAKVVRLTSGNVDERREMTVPVTELEGLDAACACGDRVAERARTGVRKDPVAILLPHPVQGLEPRC